MIVVDIETTGLERYCEIASIGAVHYETGAEFYQECRVSPFAVIEESALAINGFTEEELFSKDKQPSCIVIEQFKTWAAELNDFLLAGANIGSFDVQFLKRQSVTLWIFGYRYVDLHSVYFAKFGKSLRTYDIYVALGMAPEPQPHNALVGAKLEAEAFRRLLSLGA